MIKTLSIIPLNDLFLFCSEKAELEGVAVVRGLRLSEVEKGRGRKRK